MGEQSCIYIGDEVYKCKPEIAISVEFMVRFTENVNPIEIPPWLQHVITVTISFARLNMAAESMFTVFAFRL